MAEFDSEIIHRMTRRLNDWDYRQKAIYSVVLTLVDRSRDWLGSLVNRAGEGCAPDWAIKPTAFGAATLEALDEMPHLYPQVEILAKQLMPEHFHFVVFVREQLDRPLGQLIRGFKAGAAKRWKEIADMPAKNGRPQDGLAASSVARHSWRASSAGHSWPAWSEGFQDTILLREGQLKAMIAYVRDNPRRLAEKRANPGLFCVASDIAVPLDGGRLMGHFSAIGNRHLLSRPLAQVQCSRRYFAYRRIPKTGGGMKIAHDSSGVPIIEKATSEYEAIRARVFALAGHGSVVISPCISDGEREIAREAMLRGLPLVAMRNKGFSRLGKPPGRYFDACAEGRLLMMAPASWPFTMQEKPMTRIDATALNRLAQWLAGVGAVQVNYHGMTPLNIDSLAMEAARCTTRDDRTT